MTRTRLSVSPLEPRDVPAVIPVTGALAVGADPGFSPAARVIDTAGNVLLTVVPFGADFTGGVRAALGNVVGTSAPDLVVAAGPGGGPRIRVYDGETGQPAGDFFVYEPTFTGGVTVAVGDVDGNGSNEIITGTGAGGGPRVTAIDVASKAFVRDYFAYESSFRGGVNVAAGDVNHDGFDDFVVGTGVGGTPRVTVRSGRDLSTLLDFFAYASDFRNGVNVAAGDVNGDGFDDVISGAGPGGGPQVRTVAGGTGLDLGSFLAFAADDRGGVRVGTVDDTPGDDRVAITAASGAGTSLRLRRFDDPNGGGEVELEAGDDKGGATEPGDDKGQSSGRDSVGDL